MLDADSDDWSHTSDQPRVAEKHEIDSLTETPERWTLGKQAPFQQGAVYNMSNGFLVFSVKNAPSAVAFAAPSLTSSSIHPTPSPRSNSTSGSSAAYFQQ